MQLKLDHKELKEIVHDYIFQKYGLLFEDDDIVFYNEMKCKDRNINVEIKLETSNGKQ